MTGIAIQYLLGVYFLVSSIEFTGGTVVANTVKLICGIILIILAIIGYSPIR